MSAPHASEKRSLSGFAERGLPTDSYYDQSWWGAEPHFARGENYVSERVPQTCSTDIKCRPSFLPEKHKKTQQDSRSGATIVKWRAAISHHDRHKRPRGKWSGSKRSAKDGVRENKKTLSTQKTSSGAKKKASASSGQIDRTPPETPSVPSKPTDLKSVPSASDSMPVVTSTSGESIRPEDIIVIRRYNLGDSSAERKLKDGEREQAKRHVVRLDRSNVMSPLKTESDRPADVDSRQSLMKKRRWGGVVIPTRVEKASEVTTSASGVADESEHGRRSVDSTNYH